MDLTWTKNYPEQTDLKKEIQYMLKAFVDAILRYIPQKEIKGIYYKGSSQKNWESIIDYVPELSDVDIQILLHDDYVNAYKKYFTVDNALKMQSEIENEFLLNVSNPIHFPRPQLILLNELLKSEDYLPAPQCTITTLFGEPYLYEMPVSTKYIDMDIKLMLKEKEYIEAYPLNVIDKPNIYMKYSLKNMNYRVSPVAPRVLDILGVSPEVSWGINRTCIVKKLYNLGEFKLAHDYAMYYKCGWEYFLSGYKDTNAARRAAMAGINVLKRGIDIAQGVKKLANH